MKLKRRLAKRGQRYYDANANRLISIESDVMGVISEITLRWPELEVFYDEEDQLWVVVEVCADEVERLALTADTLDQRLIDRLHQARDVSADDLLKAIDKSNDQMERDQERQLEDIVGDAGERLMHAWKKDGIYDNFNIYKARASSKLKKVPIPRFRDA